MSKICAWCGKEYEPQTKRSSYCTEECQTEARKKRQREYQTQKRGTPKTRACVICGKEFAITHGNIKTCSEDCAKEHRRRTMHELYERNKTQEYRTCVICGKEFEVHSRTITCSMACRRKQQIQWYDDNVKDKRTPNMRTCIVCGKEFDSRNNAKVCSMECREIREKQVRKEFYQRYKKIGKKWSRDNSDKAKGEVCQVEVEHRKLDGKVLHRAEMTVDEYNRTHGTNYSYGQYVFYVESRNGMS